MSNLLFCKVDIQLSQFSSLLLSGAACASCRAAAWSLCSVYAGCGRWPQRPGSSDQ